MIRTRRGRSSGVCRCIRATVASDCAVTGKVRKSLVSVEEIPCVPSRSSSLREKWFVEPSARIDFYYLPYSLLPFKTPLPPRNGHVRTGLFPLIVGAFKTKTNILILSFSVRQPSPSPPPSLTPKNQFFPLLVFRAHTIVRAQNMTTRSSFPNVSHR